MPIYLRQICLVADSLAGRVDELSAVLGAPACYVDPGVAAFGLQNQLLNLGSQFIEVVSPTRAGTAAGRYLERRGGDGGYMVITQAVGHSVQVDCKARAVASGVRIAWEHEHHTGNFMQFHPADTGGAFLEIDWDESDDPLGQWEPAGGLGWADLRDVGRTRALKAVELQSDTPDKLAERWAAVIGAEVVEVPGGGHLVELANATLRFVPPTDQRGEGLCALDVSVVDIEAVLAAAQTRGVPIAGNSVTLCGVRFNLLRV